MARSSSPDKTRRLYILGTILSCWLLLVVFRLIQLQVLQYGEFMQRAQHQQQRTAELAARRGIIYDRNGHELAMSVTVDSAFAVPSEIPDPANTASLLARILHVDANELLTHLKASRNFCWVARKLDPEVSDRIRNMNLRGIYFMPEPKRYYPKHDMAPQVIGYVGLDDEGLGGIEHGFDDRLRGKPGALLASMDARRRRYGRVERDPEPGENIVLTIDENIQYIAEREIDKAMEDTHAEAATVVVQNPHTGEILALANRPTFNPNDSKHLKPEALKNHAVSDVYEPGSVFKTVTYSAALEERLAKPTDSVDCQGGMINVNGLRIHDLHKLGVVPVSEAFAKSSDVAAVKMGLKLGDERFYKYIRAYGFGAQTGIELPGETRGLAKPVNRWSKVSIGAMSIGQEIGVTPVQVASMISTIANDGVYLPPRIVAGFANPKAGPQTIAFHPPAGRRVISTMTAAQMKGMMEQVVLFGTARRAILDGYTSAGKTGTAQKIDPVTHTYSHTKYVASFAGFAPVNNPAVTILVVLDSAQGLHQGGQVSAPVFQRIAQQVLAYLHVPHDVELKQDTRRMQLRAAAKDSDLEEGASEPLSASLDIPQDVAESSASTPNLAVEKPSAISTARRNTVLDLPDDRPKVTPTNGTVVLEVGTGTVVPTFVGKSLRNVIETAQNAGLEVDAIGSGTAREQSPPPGSRITPGGHVAVRFAR